MLEAGQVRSDHFFWEVVVPLIEAHSSNIPTIGSPQDVQRGPAKLLRGYPVQFVNVMPTSAANSQICAMLANLKLGAYLGDRRQMKIDHPKTEVVVLTGHGSEADRDLVLEMGAFVYYQKPTNIEKLAATIVEACQKASRSQR